MQSYNQFSNRQKLHCNDYKAEKSLYPECSKNLYSSSQGQEPTHNQKATFVIPGRFEPKNAFLQRNKCNSCETDATRLCLSCNKICCDSHAVDHHDGHKKLKLSEVSETMISSKINTLEKAIAGLENSIFGKEGVSKALMIKEDELMKKVDEVYDKYTEILENQRQIIKNEIREKLVEMTADYSKNTQNNIQDKNQDIEAFKWICSAKSLSIDIEKNKIKNTISLVYSLCQQEEGFQILDTSKLKGHCDTTALEKNFNQIQIEHKNHLLEYLKNEKIVGIKINESAKKNYQIPAYIEKIIESLPNIPQPEISKKKSQDSSPIQTPSNNDVLASDWEQNKLPKFAPVQKTDISKGFKKAFEGQLEIQVKTKKDSDSILLESISKHNSNHPNMNAGLKNNTHVKIFSEILMKEGLKESCQKVSNLILDCFNLTEEGIKSLAKAITHLPSLQTVQLSFYMTLGLYPVNLKPLLDNLAELKSLKDFSLKLPTWTHLKGTAFLPLLSSISNISTLESLSLDLSRCSKLDLQGISEALKYLLRHKKLEKLQISFKGCINIDNDKKALGSLHQNCLNSTFQGIKLDFTECPKLSDECLEVINDINKRKPFN